MNKLIKPSRICLELTNHCDLACVFCDRERLKGKDMVLKDMPDELFNKILGDIKHAYSRRDKLETLVLVGLGEPTLARGLARHLHTLKSHAHLFRNIELTSNGVSLTEQKSVMLLDSPVNCFAFSINFSDREAYAKMMGRDRFDDVVRNVRGFLRLKKENKNRALVRIQLFTERGTGPRDLAKMKALFPGADKDRTVVFHLQPIYNKPVVQDNCGTLELVKGGAARHPCWCMYSIVYIDVEGFVYPCTIGNDSYRKGSALNIGNVLDKELVGIFNDDGIRRARANAEAGRLAFEECRDCNIWTLLPNVFKYDIKRHAWKKRKTYEALIKLKSRINPAIALLPYPVQNSFRQIYSLIFDSHNRKVG